ncbi:MULTISPECIES: TrkH family potassium uptake protein [Saccharibacillus]|uniref:Trk family potassium uptake protein n=1 Tax=Saccharibacillus brassicae TaxID=2583377 RepID=A0A4Y6UX81_SACBS|nr:MULTISPECIES: TrkH family potassium uptake protein [Saccharibacillus]MWJ30674.1 Trk family potassium uptake protein [Saccharibacillus sp. WB 17]QDH20981.1 Trk family potassium uptake protein [Saccharibacillus brassicae]
MFKPVRSRNPLLRLNPPQVLAAGFLVMILAGSGLLCLPAASASGQSMAYLDAVFMAASATCVTGLSVVNPGVDLTTFGQLVLIGLVQIGGLGFMTVATLIALVFRRRITFRERLILQETLSQSSTEGIIRLIRKVLVYAIVIESVGAILLFARFSFEMPLGQAAYFGAFHSISIFNNAGFDLFGAIEGRAGSLIHYVDDPFINLIAMPMILLGGIGFIVIADLLAFPKKRKLSLHSKVVLSMTGALVIVGAIVIFVFEFNNPATLKPLDLSGKTFASFFQSVTSRSAGLATLDVGALRQATQFFIVIMMFIGAAPGSAGGGIKVTTFAILIGAVLAMIRGRQDIVFFRYRIAQDRVYKAITFSLLSFLLIVVAAMILSVTENYSFLGILFETTSAYATAGISMGLTSQLTPFGQFLIIVLMFVGRLGPITLAFTLTPKMDKEPFRYPEGKVTIG